MPREIVILECTEAKAEGKPVSRYMSTRNKKLQTERVEKKKYNPSLRRHTVHREINNMPPRKKKTTTTTTRRTPGPSRKWT